MIRISVIVPVYNGAPWLGEALRSAFSQITEEDEVLVADDASSDESAAIAEGAGAKLIRLDSRRGGAAATNLAIGASRGEFLALLDADDIWLPGKCAHQLELLSDRSVPGCFTQLQVFQHPHRDRLGPPAAGLLPSSVCMPRTTWERVGPFCEDLSNGFFIDWYDRARLALGPFPVLPEVLLLRRAHEHNVTRDRAQMGKDFLKVARLAMARRRPT